MLCSRAREQAALVQPDMRWQAARVKEWRYGPRAHACSRAVHARAPARTLGRGVIRQQQEQVRAPHAGVCARSGALGALRVYRALLAPAHTRCQRARADALAGGGST